MIISASGWFGAALMPELFHSVSILGGYLFGFIDSGVFFLSHSMEHVLILDILCISIML